jgi:hypothetical protein
MRSRERKGRIGMSWRPCLPRIADVDTGAAIYLAGRQMILVQHGLSDSPPAVTLPNSDNASWSSDGSLSTQLDTTDRRPSDR